MINVKEKLNGKFKYVVLFVILFIPFIYSFFYLKAYWNPYGKGNIDNLPVAVVNNDSGDKGNVIIDGIKDSGKLKLSIVEEKKAEDGLYDGKYYAVITIPEDFTSSMESANTNNKKHATITYSPNQKSNYLASQIINTVVLNVEKNLDNEVNSKIVEGLSDNLLEVPDSLDKVTSGFDKLSDGTTKLKDGSNKIVNGSNDLKDNYSKFNDGVNSVNSGTNALYDGAKKLDDGLSELQSSLSNMDLSGLESLQQGVSLLNQNEQAFNSALQSYNTLVKFAVENPDALNYQTSVLHNMNPSIPSTDYTLAQYIVSVGSNLNRSSNLISDGVSNLNSNINGETSEVNSLKSKMVELKSGVDKLKFGSSSLLNGTKTLNSGVNTLNNSSKQILSGVSTLNDANSTLNAGINTLNNSVVSAKKELSDKTEETKEKVKKVETLSEYSKEPVKIQTKEVNKVNSYGTAFSPLFISVGLWVGCLMMFMVLYYDKEERFGIFSINDKRYVKKTLAYHGIITVSSIVLAVCLDLFLNFSVTNYGLYYLSFILVANVFMSIIAFLITNFKDIGKFIALILLVLQLGASAGTFPIETVTKGFRWMNGYLPMTYSIRLLKESLIKVQGSLLNKSLVILLIIFIVFFIANITRDIIKQKKAK